MGQESGGGIEEGLLKTFQERVNPDGKKLFNKQRF